MPINGILQSAIVHVTAAEAKVLLQSASVCLQKAYNLLYDVCFWIRDDYYFAGLYIRPWAKNTLQSFKEQKCIFFAKDCRFSSKITRELIFLNWLENGDTILCINCSYGISCFMHLQLNNINTPKVYGSTMQKDDSRTATNARSPLRVI